MNYLLRDRPASTLGTEANARYAKVQVDGVCGLLLFPDQFTWVEATMGSVPICINLSGIGWHDVSVYSSEQFGFMESRGVVFLPIGKYRKGTEYYGNNDEGHYWISSKGYGNDYKPTVMISNGSVNAIETLQIHTGCFVRLVTDVKGPKVDSGSIQEYSKGEFNW